MYPSFTMISFCCVSIPGFVPFLDWLVRSSINHTDPYYENITTEIDIAFIGKILDIYKFPT